MSIQYVNKTCPVCGGYVVLLTNGTELCEKCHYVLPGPNWEYSTSATSCEQTCRVCGQAMVRNTVGLYKWTCPKCGYHYEVTIGDPTKELDSIWKSSGTMMDAWGALGLEPQTLTITKCDKFKVQCKEMDIEFEFDSDKLQNIDTIVINGYKYVKEK